MKKNVEFQLEYILSILAYGLLFIDSLTGFFVLKFGVDLKLSILYKVIFLFLGLILLLRRDSKLFIISFSALFFIILWSIFQNIFTSGKYLLFDFGEGLKLVSTFILFFVFSTFKYIDSISFCKRLIFVSLFTLVLNVFFSLIGIGTTSYGVFGAKGFFYAANALSGIIVLLSSFVMVHTFNKSIKSYVISTAALLLLAAMVGTKSGILGVLILFGLLPLLRFNVTPKVLGALIIIFPLLIITGFYIYQIFIESAIYERIVYFYETGGITRALLSDRDMFFMDIFPSFIDQGWIRLLWGFGFDNLNGFNKDTVEMDPIDIVFIFGLFTTTLYFLIMGYIFYKIRTIPTENDPVMDEFKLSIGISSFVLFLISCIAGHILFNGVVTFIWGVTLALPFWRENNLARYASVINYFNLNNRVISYAK